MNHKRGKPKNARSGCLMCKPHKANGYSKEKKAVGKLPLLRELIRRKEI